MNIFISYSHHDSESAHYIATRLQETGHEVWIDRLSIQPGDNWTESIAEGIKDADVIIALISKHSLSSEWTQAELSSIALKEISSREQKVIPVLLDKASVPSYLSLYQYLDLTDNFNSGVDRLVELLTFTSNEEYQERRKLLDKKDESYESQIKKLRSVLRNGRLTLMCGAGVSIGAGIPSWNGLLVQLLESMMRRISQNHSIDLSQVSGKEFQERYGESSLIVGKYLKSNLGNEFLKELRGALYSQNPSSCELIDAIVDLSRPQRDGKPLDSIITFNFDALIEENLSKNAILNHAIHTEAIKHEPDELPVYHVHGYLPRTGDIDLDTEIVFSEDAYHSQFVEPFSWSNLIQLNKLSQNTCLFIGLSLTDPNLRRLLDVAQRKNPDNAIPHFIIKKIPFFSPNGDVLDDLGRFLEEQDANAMGLNVIWVNEFNEIPTILRKIAQP